MEIADVSIFYTFCPVVCTSHIALEKGFIEAEFAKEGIQTSHISKLPPTDWQSHFTHKYPYLFRDGGNIPPIWARSEGADTKVIGMVWTEPGGSLLVKKDSSIKLVSELKGKRVGLLRKLPTLIDFGRATEKKGIIAILQVHGLTQDDIQFVDIAIDIPEIGTERRPNKNDWWAISPRKGWKAPDSPLVKALYSGAVDAIFATYGIEVGLEELGLTRVLFNLQEHDNWRYLVNIGFPYICTVSRHLADERPDLVSKWMKAMVSAGLWARDNEDEVYTLFGNATRIPENSLRKHYRPDLAQQLVPEVTERGIEALENEKNFLRGHGFINNDFNVRTWVDDSFLSAAIRERDTKAS